MCGIAGYFGLTPDRALLERMNAAQQHRGPDGSGVHLDDPVGLAHQRLAVIDREGGRQPMSTADGRFTLVYNGEVYNHEELRQELESLGRTFATRCDTEVVLHALAQWGEAALDRFNGMFALALWDRDAQTLTLARDHFGIKPLHVARVSRPGSGEPAGAGEAAGAAGAWLFASEIRPILASGLVEARPDERSVYRYLCFRVHDDGPHTFFHGIERVLPGEVLTISAQGVRRRAFTSLRADLLVEQTHRDERHDPDASARFRRALTRAVRMRLRSDVPVGTSLSGGLDSSAVTALIDELLPDESARSVGPRQNTFSAVFPGCRNDEQRWVDAALGGRRDRVSGHTVKPASRQLVADLTDFVRAQEEPVISSGPYAQYCVMREASRHVTVMLDGQGADEVLAGYVPQVVVHVRELLGRHRGRGVREAFALRDVFAGLARNRARRVLLPTVRSASVTPLLNTAFGAEHRLETYAAPTSSLRERLVHDLFVGSLPSLLRYEDRNSMRFSVEGRVPFLDPDLVRFVFAQPDASVVGAGWNKRLLREAVHDVLPESITLRRNKIGFTTPQNEWFHEMGDVVRDVFLSESFARRPYFDRDAVVAAFDDWLAGRSGHDSMVFWRILNVELWLREFCDAAPEHSAGESAAPAPESVRSSLPVGIR